MCVKLRLKRYGRSHEPVFRLAVTDSRTPRDGRMIEELGSYDPGNKQPQQQFQCNKERIEYWLSVGAQPTGTVRSLLRSQGIGQGKI